MSAGIKIGQKWLFWIFKENPEYAKYGLNELFLPDSE